MRATEWSNKEMQEEETTKVSIHAQSPSTTRCIWNGYKICGRLTFFAITFKDTSMPCCCCHKHKLATVFLYVIFFLLMSWIKTFFSLACYSFSLTHSFLALALMAGLQPILCLFSSQWCFMDTKGRLSSTSKRDSLVCFWIS